MSESLPSLCGLTCVVTYLGSNAPVCTIQPNMSNVKLDLDAADRSDNLQQMIYKHMPLDRLDRASCCHGSASVRMFLAETGAEISQDPALGDKTPGFKDAWKSLWLSMLRAVLQHHESLKGSLEKPSAPLIVRVQVSKYSLSRFAIGKINDDSMWNEYNYKQLDKECQNNPAVAYASVCRNCNTYVALNTELRSSRKIALEAVQKKPSLISWCPLYDKAFILAAVQVSSRALELLQHVPYEYRHDKPFVLELVSVNGTCIRWASPVLKEDKDVALAAVKQNIFMFDCLDSHLKADKDILALFNK